VALPPFVERLKTVLPAPSEGKLLLNVQAVTFSLAVPAVPPMLRSAVPSGAEFETSVQLDRFSVLVALAPAGTEPTFTIAPPSWVALLPWKVDSFTDRVAVPLSAVLYAV
jgi:hypothetical protein